MEIVDLRDVPDTLRTLASWHHAEWGHLHPGRTVENRVTVLKWSLVEAFIPSTFVAMEGETPMGSASIVTADLPTRPSLSPWLAGVFVAPEHRRKGVGSALVRHVVRLAGEKGVRRLYLFTPDRVRFYERLGWSTREETDYRDIRVTVMEMALSS